MDVIEGAADERALEETAALEVSAAEIRPVEADEVEAGVGPPAPPARTGCGNTVWSAWDSILSV